MKARKFGGKLTIAASRSLKSSLSKTQEFAPTSNSKLQRQKAFVGSRLAKDFQQLQNSNMTSLAFGTVVQEQIKAHIHKKLNKVENRCNTMIKDFKTEVMKEASVFITSKLEDVARVLTSEHHRIIEQFIFYKNKTQRQLDMSDMLQKKYREAVKAQCLQSPCFEASFATDNRSALKLYDCLVPKVKEHALRCDRCRKIRDEKGLHDPPITKLQTEEMYAYWQ